MASANPVKANFSLDTEDFREQVREEIGKIAAATGKHIYEQLIDITPVDTGNANISWSIRGNISDMPKYAYGANLIYARPVNSQDMNEMAKLDKFYIGNTAEHIVGLNEGWLKTDKAPPHFIEQSVLTGVAMAENEFFSNVL